MRAGPLYMPDRSAQVAVDAAPRFYLTARQPMRPGVLLLALLIAGTALFGIAYGLGRTGKHRRVASGNSNASRSPAGGGGSQAGDKEDEDDDPSQIDTVVMGDAADAPAPARRGARSGNTNVHATVIVHLPRFGPDAGLIPDTPAGHLLWSWLAAFNNGSGPALEHVLPNEAPAPTSAAELALRSTNGGYNLLSARELQPGVLIFRLRDQTPEGAEALGTLQVLPGSNPPSIGSFSLRVLPAAPVTTH